MATCANLVGYQLEDNEGEDSFSMLPLFDETNQPIRKATVHHSINGSFAIRKGSWKLVLCPGSGGWSYPRPEDTAVIDTLPKYQLYNLEIDPGETNNLYIANQKRANELKTLLKKYIVEGRSTPGVPQKNDFIDFEWEQIAFIKE